MKSMIKSPQMVNKSCNFTICLQVTGTVFVLAYNKCLTKVCVAEFDPRFTFIVLVQDFGGIANSHPY